jgi:hypothetical protein
MMLCFLENMKAIELPRPLPQEVEVDEDDSENQEEVI